MSTSDPPPATNASSTANEAASSAVQPNTLPPSARGAMSRSELPICTCTPLRGPRAPRLVVAGGRAGSTSAQPRPAPPHSGDLGGGPGSVQGIPRWPRRAARWERRDDQGGKMRRTLGLVLAAVAGLALTGCAVVAGPTASEDREVGDVRAVELSTSGDLVVVQGDRPALTVTAAKPALARLTSEVTRRPPGAEQHRGLRHRADRLPAGDRPPRGRPDPGSGDVTGSRVTGDDAERSGSRVRAT